MVYVFMVNMGTLYTKHVELENKGAHFYEGNEVDEAEEEAKLGLMQL